MGGIIAIISANAPVVGNANTTGLVAIKVKQGTSGLIVISDPVIASVVPSGVYGKKVIAT